MEYLSSSSTQTEEIGRMLGKSLAGGEIIALYGDLGAGKTVFAKGVAMGLGISAPITSPTFAIVHTYNGRFPFMHFDMYRLSGSDELLDIGWDDYVSPQNVILLEWSERVEDILPQDAIRVEIVRTGENSRKITVKGEKAKCLSLQ